MLKTQNPQAWQQLIKLLAEQIADKILSEDETGADLRDNLYNQNHAENHARNHLRPVLNR
ncbi:hypothetical protein ACO0LG_01795 [Undibacterium sp. Ji42W]|uniref:hypothetical protein n=1 Tax=Undibacterium sp. Ji42W TaxID=3413039 RepID=UPI003BF1BE8F